MMKLAAAAAAAAAAAQQQQQQASINDSGVTTRLQREAQMRTDPVSTTSGGLNSNSNLQTSTVTITTTSSLTTTSTVTLEAIQSPSDSYSDPSFAEKPSIGEQSASDSAGDSDSEEETILNASNAVGTGGPHPCVVCKAALEHHGQSRPLPKHQASQYGLLEADISVEARVFSACRCVVRRRYVQCPLPTCPTAKRRVKRLRPMPNKWNELPAEIRTALENEFQIGQDIIKCCSTCCNRITRKLALLTDHSSGLSSEGNGSASLGTDINVSTIRSEDGLNDGGTERKSERKSSTSSGEDDVTVTDKSILRPEHHYPHHLPPQTSHQLLPPRSIPIIESRPIMTTPTAAVRIGIPQPPDNSETDSADEGGQGQPIPVDNPPPPNPVRNGNIGQEALTVRDLVSGVIESQLKKTDSHALSVPPGVIGSPIYPPGPSESPTIESILKDSQRNYALGRNSAPLTVVTNIAAPLSGPRPVMPHLPETKQPTILILDSTMHPSRRTSPYPQGFIHAGIVAPLPKDIEYNVQEGLAFRMHRDVVPVEGQTLDLSMPKKRDTGGHPQPSAHGSSHGHVGAQSPYAPPPAHITPVGKDMHPQQQQQHYQQRNPPQTILLDQLGGYSPIMRPPYPPRSTPPSQNYNRGSSSGGGSIIQGTPISSAMPSLQVPRTDGLLRPTAMSGRDSMSGSITQGTPIVVSKDGVYEAYYAKGGQPPSRLPDPRMPISTSAYQLDPRLNSQAIMMNDYLLSQQMAERNSGSAVVRREREPSMGGMPPQPQILVSSRANDRSAPPQQPAHPTAMYQYRSASPMYIQKPPYGPEGHHGYPPHSSGAPQQLQHPTQQPTPLQQQRQGVIQRNSSVPSVRQQPDSRPLSAPGGPPHQQSPSARTSSPASGQHLLSLGSAGGRPAPVSISPRGDFIHSHDAFTSLVNAAAAQPSLPVPNSDRDRRDVRDNRDREKDVRLVHHGMVARSVHSDRRDEPVDRLAPHPYQRESPKMASGPPQPPTSSTSNSASTGSGGGDCTLTAASLIDAIITHQINQTSNPNESGSSGGSGGPGGPPNSKSGVDSLFNQYRRNASPVAELPRSQLPVASSSAHPGHGKSERHLDEGAPNPSGLPSQRPPSLPALSQQPPPPPSTKAAFTLGEHIESIIAKDFHQGSGSTEQDKEREWQRRALQAEHFKSRTAVAESSLMNSAAIEFAAKCRAAENQQQQVQDYSSSAPRRDGVEPDLRHQQQQQSISPLDYVKKKIVEVMRTNSDGLSGVQMQGSTEMAPPSSPAGRRGPSPAPSPSKRPRLEGDGEQQPQQQQQRGGPSPIVPHYLSSGVPYPTIGYPYTIPPNIPISSASSSGSASGHQQPVVVLSSQYEPLSDED